MTQSTEAPQATVRATKDAVFACRLVYIDHYTAPPLSKSLGIMSGSDRYVQHPVIRVFGATPTGQKTCVHIHGVSNTCTGIVRCVMC